MASVAQQNHPQNRSLFGHVSDLWRETTTLVHEEAELAKAELNEKVSQVKTDVGEIAAGAGILFAGFIIFLFAVVGALLLVLPEPNSIWLAPLIVGGLVMFIGYITLARGRNGMKARNLAPQRTMDSLRRDANLAKERIT